jgi:uncharacterized metal-binding protein YceD (DUF177 family)
MTPCPEFSRIVEVARLRAEGETLELIASPAECAALARRLGLEAVASMGAVAHLVPAGAGVVEVTGAIRARLSQICVVSLDPFDQTLEVPLRLVFRPGTEADLAADQTIDPETEDEVPYEGGRFDLGESVVETLALALDPWPRRPDAVLEVPPPAESPSDGPFAALARRHKP